MKYFETKEVKITAYAHKLNTALVSGLKQLVDFYEAHLRPANVDKDLDLTYNQESNFQKLRYWKLVHRDKSGWVPTHIGMEFIHGEIKILDTAGSLEGEPLDDNHKAWETHERIRQKVGVHDFIPTSYLKREDYQKQRPEKLNLFSLIS